MDFPTFFSLSLNFAIRSSWSELQIMFLLTVKSFSIFGCKKYNQSVFGIDHLVVSMCRVISCVVGRGCLLWPVPSLGKTLLAFALLHFVLQGQTCLLLQVSQLGVIVCFGSSSSFFLEVFLHSDFPGGSDGKASVYNVGDAGSIPGLGRAPGEGNGNPLQYYCLENP